MYTEAVKIKTLTASASAIIVALLLLTRLPMKRGKRPTVSAYIGVIILFLANGIITPNSL